MNINTTGVNTNTTRKTMETAGALLEKGIHSEDIIDRTFYKKSYVQNQILGRALLESVLFYDGKCIFSSVTRDEMDFYGVTGRELGGIIEQLRLTDGVEVAIFLYETGDNEYNEYKVSLRSKKEIEDTIDTLNIAFEKLLDSLFQDTAWDVSSDISVLHTMLAQEGLTEDGLKK